MKFLSVITVIICAQLSYAQCNGPLRTYSICNYRGNATTVDLHKSSGGKISKGWYKLEVSDLTVYNLDGSKRFSEHIQKYKFTVGKNINLKLVNYKIIETCNDVRIKGVPADAMDVSEVDSGFCKKYPSNSLIIDIRK